MRSIKLERPNQDNGVVMNANHYLLLYVDSPANRKLFLMPISGSSDW